VAWEEWEQHLEREVARFRDGEARLPEIDDPDVRQRQLTRMGNAAWGAGLSSMMLGDRATAATWFDRAVESYHDSLETAPPGSWGRYIGPLKCRILAVDWAGAEDEAHRTLAAEAQRSESPIGRYAAALSFLVLGADDEAAPLGRELRAREDFPRPVADAVATLAAADRVAYREAIEAVLASFEERDEYLEDVPVADTVMVLQAMAESRGMAAELSSPLLPRP
jgi:hypothetical protein